MNISSNSLFHYTPKFEYLQGILERGFEFRESREELPLAGYKNCIFDQLGITVHEHHSWIVCFCDLPLSLSARHRDQYGKYVIGMTKEWGMRNRVTPIRYVHAGSPDFSSDFYNLVLDTPGTLKSEGVDMHGLYARMLSENGLLAASDEEMNALSPGIRMVLNAVHSAHMSLIHQVQRLLPLVRVYEGAWIDRMTQKETMRVFYDEREWRGASFGDEKALRFKFEDVRYLVVQLLGQRNQPTLLPGSYVQAASRDDFQQVDFRDR